MRTTMLTDRIGARADSADFLVLGGRMTDGGADAARWTATKAGHLRQVTALARSVGVVQQ